MISIITGVGSRQTPENILTEAKKIGEWCCLVGVSVRSGHVEGFDWYIEQGAQHYCRIYLPWQNFNSHLKSRATPHVFENNRAEAISKKYHPAYNSLSVGAKKLIDRDAYQILGSSLHTPSDIVVCWTEEAKVVGGTGQVLRIALAYNIPILNMALDQYNTAEKITTALKEL